MLKRLLVDLCIKGGYIDGYYKQIGAGCSKSRAFVAIDGTPLADKKFSIRCQLETSDVLSYADSFKFFAYDRQIAYNYHEAPHDYCLDTTDYNRDVDYDEEDEDELEYDEYHDGDVEHTTRVYYHGNEIYCDSDDLDDFVWIDSLSEYHHQEDVTQCDACGEWLVRENATYNSDAEAYFCDSECEASYIREHFVYSEYDDDYFCKEEDVTTIQKWDEETQNYRTLTISCLSRDYLIKEGKAFGAGDTWFTTAA